jgi:hypothetical protein
MQSYMLHTKGFIVSLVEIFVIQDLSIYVLIIAQQLMFLLIIQFELKEHSRQQMLGIHWPRMDGLLRQSEYQAIGELKVIKKQINLLNVVQSRIKHLVPKPILPMHG